MSLPQNGMQVCEQWQTNESKNRFMAITKNLDTGKGYLLQAQIHPHLCAWGAAQQKMVRNLQTYDKCPKNWINNDTACDSTAM